MEVYFEPPKDQWKAITARPAIDSASLQENVKTILKEVKENGNAAIKKYTLRFDAVNADLLETGAREIDEAAHLLSPALKKAIETAAQNIRRFHDRQQALPEYIETMPGVKCWRKSVAIEKTGFYIPGGSAPLFSTVLMLGIPARIAGCREIVLCTPPSRVERATGSGIHPAILFAAGLAGITRIFAVGGVQAIAAMAYGTETIPAVYKIFGPGNQYVNCAKQLVQAEGVSIDMPAGPSEVCVLADDSCEPSFVAADILAQAEHGADSQAILVCTSPGIEKKVIREIEKQLTNLPRRDITRQALTNSRAVVLQDLDMAIELVNEYAPEHLILACRNPEIVAGKIRNAGSVFLGNYSPETAGDYASGTNHVLPTSGFAKSYSGVSVDSFVKKITYQQISKEGLQQLRDTVETMAAAEGLEAHRNAVSIRLA